MRFSFLNNLLFLGMIMFVFGCSKDETVKSYQDQAKSSDEFWVCRSHGYVDHCISSLSKIEVEKLNKTINSYGQRGGSIEDWSIELLDTKSFVLRYPMTKSEKQCIKNSICSKVVL